MSVEKKTKKPVPAADRDELAQLIADSLNKLNKDSDQVAYFLDGREETPTDFTDFISTGATMLDIAVSNRMDGGIAVGRITELTGLEGSGKSLVGAQLIANTQKRGGVAVLIDTETAVNPEFFRAVGIDMNKLVYVHLSTVEDIFDAITNIIEKVRSGKDKDKLVTIIVDSVAAASTKKEMEADFGKDGYATDKAIIISKAMRKITGLLGRERIALVFTNQLRQKMNAPAFSDPWTTSGGKAIAFHASTRIRLSLLGKIQDSNKNVIGVDVKASIIKIRLGPPHRTAEFKIYFDRGIDDYGSWLDVMKDNGLVKQSGAWYTLVDETTGEELKFQSKDFPKLLEEDKARKRLIYEKICNVLIMKYRTEYDPDKFTVDTGDDDVKQLLLD
jgi:recombination protein RecA